MEVGVNALNGLSSFLQKVIWREINGRLGCVNTLNGLSSFLLKEGYLNTRTALVCQRPKRAFFISTTTLWTVTVIFAVCQRPKRAFFISTEGRTFWYLQEKGVNALNGLSSFLQKITLAIPRKKDVSTP